MFLYSVLPLCAGPSGRSPAEIVGLNPTGGMNVLSSRGLCDGLITRPEESYRLWRVVVCDQETWNSRRLKPATGLWKIQPKWVVTPRKQTNKQLPLFYEDKQRVTVRIKCNVMQ
jgi:hypothetical protein